MESIRRYSINAALKRVLPSELKADAPRLFTSNASTAEQTDEFLWRMGCLTMAERQLTLLRSGALKGEIDKRKLKGMTLLVLSIQDNTAYREQVGFQGLNWLSDMTVAEDRPKDAALEHRHMEILPRLTDYLRSNPSPENLPFDGVDDYFNEWAVLYLRRMSFRDMLADDDRFGGRAYSVYVAVLEALSAMSQQRLCYAGLLNADDPRIGIRNLLTGGALHEELIEGVRAPRSLYRTCDAPTTRISWASGCRLSTGQFGANGCTPAARAAFLRSASSVASGEPVRRANSRYAAS